MILYKKVIVMAIWTGTMNRMMKSRASVTLARSVVTRLLILPTRCWDEDCVS